MPQVRGRPRDLLAHNGCRFLILLALVMPSTSQAEWVEWIFNAEATVIYDDNVNRSAFDNDARRDTIFAPVIAAGRFYQLGTHTRLRLTANLEADAHRDYDDLNNVRFGGSASLWHKFGTGPTEPWVRADVSALRIASQDELRDGALFKAGLRTGTRFSNRLDGWVEYLYTRRDGEEGDAIPGVSGPGTTRDTDVFDQTFHTLTARLGYLLTPELLLNAGVSYRTGDFVSSCNGDNVVKVLTQEHVEAITFDEAFRDDPGKPFCAYRLEGSGYSYTLGLSYALGRHASISLEYEANEIAADKLEYDNAVWRLSLIYVH